MAFDIKCKVNNLIYSFKIIIKINICLENKKSTELFLNLDKNRPRRVLNNLYTREIMIEWYQYGKAWDNDTFKASGREFRR